MPVNSARSHVERLSCGGCSLHADLQQVDIREGELHLSGPACTLANHPTASDGPLRGVPFALASLGLFIVPALLAMVGAILGASDQNGQFLGATSGLLVGMLVCVVVARVLRAEAPELPKGEAP